MALWMHSRNEAYAHFHFKAVHEKFAELADALGYDITERKPATDEVAA